MYIHIHIFIYIHLLYCMFSNLLFISNFFFSFCLSISDPLEVLQAMRGYVKSFFGCRPCATHFESMAQENVNKVTSLSAAVIWLWSRHNRVNNRLAGGCFYICTIETVW